ncbi:ATP-dependent DNA helicase RecG [Slackia heliotrinireducens]|uniref:ATP-dependent DNA helicase RecG n=1 Tax=Slackia heliotrinireducens TaxID=84110 RepID=UPI003314F2DD
MQDRLAATLELDAPVTSVSGVSSGRAAGLSRLGIRTVRDLLQHFPHRYVDMSRISTIEGAGIGDSVTIVGTIHEVRLKRPRPRLSLTEVTIVDGTGTLIATFFRQPWIAKTLKTGTRVSVAGTLEFNYGYKRMTAPFLDVLEDDQNPMSGQIVPVHHATGKVTPGIMRLIVRNAVDSAWGAYDPLPLELRTKYRLMSRSNAYRSIHFPQDMRDVHQARRRLAYEEVLMLQMHMLISARERQDDGPAHEHVFDGPYSEALMKALPFSLTSDQERAVAEIQMRMAQPKVMSHMLLGDVGTGKTAVAGFAIAAAADARFQTFMMAPTEVLATQYAASLGGLFDQAGISWALLTGSTPAEDREDILMRLASGHTDVVFGTHALLEDDVVAHDCGLVIIDEQQRFGVDQRKRLIEKGRNADALFMTATPIPRTLALALYGNLSLSYLRQVPFDRPPRKTQVVDFRDRGKAYDAALAACRRGEQVYVVCPLVGQKRKADDDKKKDDRDAEEEAPSYIESDEDMRQDDQKAAEAEAAFLQSKVFADFKVGLLHGRMDAKAKHTAMEDFRAGQTDVLVCTTVIEVGVDVPNATVMIIEDADRFGLSQLHQLRGRVGRGTKPGEVYLIAATSSEDALERLSAMEATDDGFELAERDLALRREGDILGNRQHGASVLRLVNIVRDGKLIELAHEDAEALLDADPEFETPAMQALVHEVQAWFPHTDEDTTIGG